MSKSVPHHPIGVFDSGIGGLTILNSLIADLPSENIVYVGDTLHHPYGNRELAMVQQRAAQITEFLLQQHCKMIVIACHTLSSIAYTRILEQIAGRALVINLVDPLVESLALAHVGKHLGLIATKLTIDSNVYQKKIASLDSNITISACAAQLLASAIESHGAGSMVSLQPLLHQYLNSLPKNIDGLILGCTHYTIIKEQIAAFYQGQISIIDVNPVIGDLVKSCLVQAQLLNDQLPQCAQYICYASSSVDDFAAATHGLLGQYRLPLQFLAYGD